MGAAKAKPSKHRCGHCIARRMANAWWVLPANLNEVTKEAIVVAVDRGWMIDRGDSVCLTDVGRDLVDGR